MQTAAQKLIATALTEVGYLEKATNSNLDSKTANAGSNNYTKYARDLDAIPGFYNAAKNGYAWCDMFHDWCMVTTFGAQLAQKMMYHNKWGAGCKESSDAYKANNAWSTVPQIGAQIFFGYRGVPGHTGIVEKFDDTYVYTIEGNTSGASGIIANGGGVCRKTYRRDYAGIVGYGIHNFSLYKPEEEDEDMVKRYARLKDIPDGWDKKGNPRAMINAFMDAGLLGGNGDDPDGNNDLIDISLDMIRIWTVEFRAGMFDAVLKNAGVDISAIRDI